MEDNNFNNSLNSYIKDMKHSILSYNEEQELAKKIADKRYELLEKIYHTDQISIDNFFTNQTDNELNNQYLSIENKNYLNLRKFFTELNKWENLDKIYTIHMNNNSLDHKTLSIKKNLDKLKNKFISNNLRLVINIAKRYNGNGVELEDLIQEGNIGLIKALDRFDYKKGYRFSTYGSWWIRQGIIRTVQDKSKTIRLPSHINEKLYRINEIKNKIEVNNGKSTREDLAKEMEMSSSELDSILQKKRNILSLELELGENHTLQAIIEDEKSPSPEKEYYNKEIKRLIHQGIDFLNDREKEIIKLRFGLGKQQLTLEEIGDVFSLTRERIRQVELEALKKLKHPARIKYFQNLT